MGVPRQRGKEDSLEKGPHSSSWPFQHTTHAAYNPGAICQEVFFHVLHLLNTGMLLPRMAVQKVGPDSHFRP